MRIINLVAQVPTVYTSNAYLVLGDWSAIGDVNTLIDTGSDADVLKRIEDAPTGVGKCGIEQVVLTHSHSDHISLLPQIRKRYNPVVYAFSPYAGADVVLTNGQILRCGDRSFEVMYTPGHSNDSICLFCSADGVLFTGDTNVAIRASDGTYEDPFVSAFERISRLDVHSIYPGHGAPVTSGADELIKDSMSYIRDAKKRHPGRSE